MRPLNRPLNRLQIRDINREIDERLEALTPLKTLVIIKSTKGRKCYGIGLNDPKRDLILRNFVRLMQSAFKGRGSGTLITATLVDTGGTSRSVYGASTAADVLWTAVTAAVLGTRLGFGNPASTPTPTRTDYELASLVSMIDPSAVSIDETNWRVIVTGSYVWAAGGTVREAGLYYNGRDTSLALQSFLIYHDAVSDVVVPAGGTVSVTYTTQF